MNDDATSQGAKKILTFDPSSDDFDFYHKFDQVQGKESRKTWYNDATEAYLQARPRYPDALIDDALERAQLEPGRHWMLEVGCGPGTATVALANRGYRVTALDPAPQNCAAARRQCEAFGSRITVVESTFEDYRHAEGSPPIAAILCPTSFHWIQPDVACQKTAQLLRPSGGCLLLWWALPPMPSQEVCDAIQDIYDDLDESQLGHEIRVYLGKGTSEPRLEKLGQKINESGFYQPSDTPLTLQPATSYYTPERFIMLLSTLSPYIALPEVKRTKLFERLLERLTKMCQDTNTSELELTNFFGSQIFWVLPKTEE